MQVWPHGQSDGMVSYFVCYRKLPFRVTIFLPIINQIGYWSRIVNAGSDTSRRQGLNHLYSLLFQPLSQNNALAIVTALKIAVGALELVNLFNLLQFPGNNFMVFLSFLQKTSESINLNGSNRSLQLIHAIVKTQKIHIVLAGNFTFAVRTIDTKGTL